MNFHDLDNFNLADAVKFHSRLNPRIWGSDEHLLPEVREKLLAIAADFQEFLGVDDLRVQDITVSGSNAAYSYTPHSDIDLHLVVAMPDDPVYQELFAAKKYQYNDEHSIRIAGVPVELYVQPADQKHVSQGIYSIKNGDWNQVPQRRRARVDDSCVQHKAADLDARIHSAVKSGDADAINRLWDRIKDMRKTGLEQNGEFGCENITFKLLRNMGCIGRLKDAKNALRDRELSLEQSNKPRERKRMNYGMRDYWFPGTAYAGQDHPAGTESEQVDESVDPDQLKKILHRFYKSCVSKLELKNPPQLRLETTPDWSRENGSFGQYESETNTLILATYGRHVLDILRTMAHEMTHRQQDEREPLPIDAGETGSPWEDQANAMAGRIMRQWAEEQPDMFDGVTLEEASGYIPTKAQARDPRFVMALTKDVRPGAVGREANKLGLQTDSQGHPALLTAGLQKLLREFKEQDLFEINMGGKNLRREAAKTGALAGMEFEMYVPNTSSDDDEDMEPDWDQDERASSPSDIQNFFYDGDYNSRRSAQELVDQMMDDYSNWQVEVFDTRWDSDKEQYIYQYIKENLDDNDIRALLGFESEDDLGKNEYLLAAGKIATEQLEPFYSEALDLSRDEYYENDNFDEWLNDADLKTMSEIADRYSGIITWPHYTSSGGDTSIEDIAEDFGKAIGRPTRASSGYHSSSVERPAPGKNFYIVEPDGSLTEPDDSDDSGLEFVSPPLPIDEIMSDLNKVQAWANRMGCYTNDSTGLHINISVPNYDLARLDFVKLALLMGDEYVLEQFGRVGNTYARSAMGKVRDHVRQRPFEAKYLLDKMKGHMGALASKAIHSGSTEKYTSINTKDGHIEFRSPGGDWLGQNFDKIENTLMRFTVAMSAALDPEAYRQEYLKKLYKMLAPKDEKDPLAVFAKYAAGELPAAALKSFVRQAQAERKTQKDIKNSKDLALWKVIGSSNLPTQARGLTVKARNELEAFDQAAKEWNLNPELREKDYYEFNGWTAVRVNGIRWRVSLKPELGGGVAEVIADDPIDAKKQAIIQQPNWRFVDDAALTITRLDEPAAGASTTQSHPEGRGRPNDPNGRLAIVNRDDPLVFAYSSGTPSPAPDYLFRFTLGDGYSQAQLRSVLAAWAARENANAADYMVVDTTQFAAPASAPEVGSVQWNIINRNNETVHTFWNRNVQRDANTAAHQWLQANYELPLVDGQGPFDVVPAAGSQTSFIPGSTLDLQRQRMAAASMAADAAPSMASQSRPTPIPGVQDIEPDVAQYTSQPAQSAPRWEVYRRSDGVSMFPLDAATQAQAWAEGRQWVQQTSNDTGITLNPADYSVRQSAQPVAEGSLEELANTSLKVKEPKDFVNTNARKQVVYKVMKFKSGKDTYLINFTVKSAPAFGKKQNWNAVNVAFGVREEQDDYSFGDEINTDLTARNKNQFLIYSTVINAVRKFITEYNTEIDEIIMQGAGERQAVMYQRFFQSAGKYFPGWHHDGKHSLVRDVPRQKVKKVREQDLEESREITKLHKLDLVLERCISMIQRGQESNPEKYGRVAACLIDNKNNHTYAINLPGPDGTRRHAERVAIDTHLERHGRIGPNAIMITTLSPCVNDMSERDGESCTDLLSDYGIEKCYAGWQDPTQQPAEDYPFNLQITNNADIFNTCQDIAASFLPQTVADNLNETVNPDCFDPAFNDTQHFDGLTYRATVEEEYGKPVLTIKVLDDNFQQAGVAKFKQSKNGVVSLITSFRPEYQGQGLARNIYAYVRAMGNTIVPSRNQLPSGKAMWAAWKKSGDAKHLMRESASEREIAQVQYMQGECAVLALTIRNMNPQRFTLGFVYEFFDSVPDMYIEPDEFDELDPARQQDIQYSYQNWTLTHAYVYDVLTREYIDAEGRHKQLPMIGRDLNATRHNKFPAETQDLVNVSHHMEWDEAQEKWIVLQGWDAIDKAYTPEDKQRAREYAIKYLGIDQPAQAVTEDSEHYNGIELSMEIEKDDEYVDDDDYDNQTLYVRATSGEKELGHVLFSFDGEYLLPQDLEVEERYRGRGIAQTMYDFVKSKGYKIRRSGQQTDAGAGFWAKHRAAQNVWEQDDSEVKSHDFMAGHCHVMALALKQLHPDWQIRAHIGYDDDEADDTEYRVDHVYTVAPDGTAYDCRGKFDNEQQLVGPDATGGVDTQYVNFGSKEIKQAMLRGELKRFSKQDLDNAMQVGKQVVAEDQVYEADASAVQFQTASTDNYQSSFTVTAIADGKNVGHFSFFRDPETDDVHNQAEVTDDVRGKGYGKALLLKAIEVANDHGLGFQEDSQSLSRAQSRVYDSLYDAGWIVDADGYWFLTPEGEHELARLSTIQQDMAENFADGRNPQDKGDAKRHGIPKHTTLSQLDKIGHGSGRKAQLARWQANMRRGRAK